jgi:hypothetical protein
LSILLRIRYKPASLLWSHLRIVRSLRIVFVLRYPLVKASFLRTIQITPGSGWSGQNLKAAAESCRRHCVTSLPTQDWSTPEPTYPPCRKLRSRREPKRLRVGCIHWRGQTQDFVAPPLKRTCCTVVDTHELEGRGCVASVGMSETGWRPSRRSGSSYTFTPIGHQFRCLREILANLPKFFYLKR